MNSLLLFAVGEVVLLFKDEDAPSGLRVRPRNGQQDTRRPFIAVKMAMDRGEHQQPVRDHDCGPQCLGCLHGQFLEKARVWSLFKVTYKTSSAFLEGSGD
jgi:hypothetical protein